MLSHNKKDQYVMNVTKKYDNLPSKEIFNIVILCDVELYKI
jgi:hypothetical protein